MREWISRLGFDRHLYNIESRAFVITFHTIKIVEVTARDALKTDLDGFTHSLIAMKQMNELGPKKDFI